MTQQRDPSGQSMVEYMIGVAVVLMCLLFAARPKGPLQNGLNTMLDGIGKTLGKSADEAAKPYNR